eukprot:1475822-Rhodomonas_salina.1
MARRLSRPARGPFCHGFWQGGNDLVPGRGFCMTIRIRPQCKDRNSWCCAMAPGYPCQYNAHVPGYPGTHNATRKKRDVSRIRVHLRMQLDSERRIGIPRTRCLPLCQTRKDTVPRIRDTLIQPGPRGPSESVDLHCATGTPCHGDAGCPAARPLPSSVFAPSVSVSGASLARPGWRLRLTGLPIRVGA